MKTWDPIERRYVDRIDAVAEAMETFGALPSGVWECDGPVRFRPIANDNTTPRADKRNAYITTYRGRFYPFAPQAADVNIEDIAHSLAMQCRYAGHGKRFYSVAEHSVHVARWCLRNGTVAALHGLLHDGTEAYLVDVPRPIKAHLVGYKDAEAAVWLAIAEAFDLDCELPAIVHTADSRIIADEMTANLWEVDPSYKDPLGIRLEFWPPDIAELYFLDTFKHLTADRAADRRAA